MARTHQRYSDELLADHLAVGKTVAAAARAAGISERTAYRRKKQPAVRDRIDEVRRAALDTASGQLHQGMVSACDTLTGLFGHANPHVQIRAAQTVIQLALKVRREVDVADRLDPVEEPAPPSSVGPAYPDTGAPPAGLEPGGERTDRSDRPRSPEQHAPEGSAGPPSLPAPSHAGIELASGGSDGGTGAGLDPPPAPTHPGGTPGLDRRPRPDRAARLAAVVGVLLLLAGLPCAFAGAMRARGERGPVADGTLPTCQSLPEPATAEVRSRFWPLGELAHAAAGSNSPSRVQAPTATATAGRRVPGKDRTDGKAPTKRRDGFAPAYHRRIMTVAPTKARARATIRATTPQVWDQDIGYRYTPHCGHGAASPASIDSSRPCHRQTAHRYDFTRCPPRPTIPRA